MDHNLCGHRIIGNQPQNFSPYKFLYFVSLFFTLLYFTSLTKTKVFCDYIQNQSKKKERRNRKQEVNTQNIADISIFCVKNRPKRYGTSQTTNDHIGTLTVRSLESYSKNREGTTKKKKEKNYHSSLQHLFHICAYEIWLLVQVTHLCSIVCLFLFLLRCHLLLFFFLLIRIDQIL